MATVRGRAKTETPEERQARRARANGLTLVPGDRFVVDEGYSDAGRTGVVTGFYYTSEYAVVLDGNRGLTTAMHTHVTHEQTGRPGLLDPAKA